MRVLVINPGSTSTKLALIDVRVSGSDEPPQLGREAYYELPTGTLDAPIQDLQAKRALVLKQVERWPRPDAVAARGGLLGPLESGVYLVDETIVEASMAATEGYHPANLGAPLGAEVARLWGVKAYLVDPPTVDELWPRSRVSGVRGIERRSRVHALNLRYVARRTAERLGGSLARSCLIGAHLGGGSSVALFVQGAIRDATDALLGEGPFGANRAGSLPVWAVMELLERLGSAQTRRLLSRGSGFLGLVGTQDLREVEARMGEPQVKHTVIAYALSVARHMAGMAAQTRPDAFFLTGGAARFTLAMEEIERRLSWMAPVMVWPGEFEMEALAEGVWRVEMGMETLKGFGRVHGKG